MLNNIFLKINFSFYFLNIATNRDRKERKKKEWREGEGGEGK